MNPKSEIPLKTGYKNGLIGWVAMQHGIVYEEGWNFGKFFEGKVATELSSFMESYDPTHSCTWYVEQDGQFLGSISLDGSHGEKDGAHLRWFIMDSKAKGKGLGRKLLESAIEFAKEKGFYSIYLWTLAGQEPAASLYRKCGFELEESVLASQWGREVQEEKLRLTF